jgi:hypothetical protein
MNQLSRNLMCIQIRSGMQIWVERERAENLMQILASGNTKFIEFEGQVFNGADIVGVFKAQTMSEYTRRKNGEWQCKYDEWHKKNETCSCRNEEWCRFCGVTPCQC